MEKHEMRTIAYFPQEKCTKTEKDRTFKPIAKWVRICFVYNISIEKDVILVRLTEQNEQNLF